MKFVDGQKAQSELAQEMEQDGDRGKRQDEMRREYMTLYMEYQKQHRAGIEEGMRRGRAEGRAEGRQAGTLHTALRFMRAGTPLHIAAQIAEVPEDELRAFAQENGMVFS